MGCERRTDIHPNEPGGLTMTNADGDFRDPVVQR
jgi:hypothetical protein